MSQHIVGILEQVKAARVHGFDLVCAGQHYLTFPYQALEIILLLSRVASEFGNMYLAATVLLTAL